MTGDRVARYSTIPWWAQRPRSHSFGEADLETRLAESLKIGFEMLWGLPSRAQSSSGVF
jgi:hypothetical protein